MITKIKNIPKGNTSSVIELDEMVYTCLAFIGLTGRDLVIVCAMKAEDMEKMTTEKGKVFHVAAYKRQHYL